jgi:hypothetical protein
MGWEWDLIWVCAGIFPSFGGFSCLTPQVRPIAVNSLDVILYWLLGRCITVHSTQAAHVRVDASPAGDLSQEEITCRSFAHHAFNLCNDNTSESLTFKQGSPSIIKSNMQSLVVHTPCLWRVEGPGRHTIARSMMRRLCLPHNVSANEGRAVTMAARGATVECLSWWDDCWRTARGCQRMSWIAAIISLSLAHHQQLRPF